MIKQVPTYAKFLKDLCTRVSKNSPGEYRFFGTHTDSTLFRYSPGLFFDTRTDSTFSEYSLGFYNFLVLTLIRPFFGTRPEFFDTRSDATFSEYSPGFYNFSVLTLNRPFFWYSPWLFCDTRTDSTFSGYLPGIYDLSVLTLTRPFSDTRPDYFSILLRILPFRVTRPNSTIFWYSH